MINPHNITRHELLGLEIEVTGSKNKSLVGKKGAIIAETRNTLTVRNGKAFKLMKASIVFRARLGNCVVEVDGKSIVGRPEDRIKK